MPTNAEIELSKLVAQVEEVGGRYEETRKRAAAEHAELRPLVEAMARMGIPTSVIAGHAKVGREIVRRIEVAAGIERPRRKTGAGT